jgi:hypothetical protein
MVMIRYTIIGILVFFTASREIFKRNLKIKNTKRGVATSNTSFDF